MSKRVIVKNYDEIVDVKSLDGISYEADATNISLEFDEIFKLSIFDKVSNIMRYYDIERGEAVLKETEILGEK